MCVGIGRYKRGDVESVVNEKRVLQKCAPESAVYMLQNGHSMLAKSYHPAAILYPRQPQCERTSKESGAIL